LTAGFGWAATVGLESERGMAGLRRFVSGLYG
jgi:hypothetical protein